MIENIGQYFTTVVTVLGGVAVILSFWNEWVYKPALKRREELAEKRNQELIAAYQQFSEPSNKLLEDNQDRISKLEEIAVQNSELLSRQDERLDNHNERLIVLETKNGIRKIKYTEKD